MDGGERWSGGCIAEANNDNQISQLANGGSVRIRSSSLYLRWTSLIFILAAMMLTVIDLVQYSRQRANYPGELTIANIPVGGIDPQAAAQRILQVYSAPVEIHYGNAVIHLDPTLVGFQLNIESMLAAADLQRTGSSFWGGFWDSLWNRRSAVQDIPLVASYSESRLRTYLQNEVSSRYDQPSSPAQPVPGSPIFTPGTPGLVLDTDRAIVLIENALFSSSERTIMLSATRAASIRPSMQTLNTLLIQLIDQNRFTGIVDLYLLDLQTNEELHFAYWNGNQPAIVPDIAFTASSTIKIPIMVSILRANNGRVDDATSKLLLEMIKQSENPPADLLMESLDDVRGPLLVSDDMQMLGLSNTFLAGYFYDGAPLLSYYRTPANQRTDINTDPDWYNQTTPTDMGMLLTDIYQCEQTGGGSLVAVFPGQIDQSACQFMVELLKQNFLGVLIQAGVPEGTAVAHKHGWVNDEFGVMHNVSDAGIVYTPGGDYVLAIYIYDSGQIIWDQASHLYADLSRAIYSFFNLPVE